MTSYRFSVAIIALNEEAHLPGLLERLAFADEVVVVDGGSSDQTVAVARRFGCKVIERPFDSFANQRNAAIAACTGDWVLSLDADERPSAALIDEIFAAIETSRHSGYRIPIRSRILGKPVRRSGTQDDCPVRLFRREAGRWTGDVHERLVVAGRIGKLERWIDHDTLPDWNAFLSKIERYTTLEAAGRVEAGIAPRPLAAWIAPPREIFRRLIWKQGLLDGPAGWTFCLLSGYSEWILARKHRRRWLETQSITK